MYKVKPIRMQIRSMVCRSSTHNAHFDDDRKWVYSIVWPHLLSSALVTFRFTISLSHNLKYLRLLYIKQFLSRGGRRKHPVLFKKKK
ncbi:hypothetical protein M747DRAFT_59263 [Aspergillus niger ATCC 13496]|nr:hypothetical protein M747DRAFT_59263 [Aspergillus niger ATCC 13496]